MKTAENNCFWSQPQGGGAEFGVKMAAGNDKSH